MENQNNKFKPILYWLSPSGSGLIIYLALGSLTLAVSNASFFQNFFDLPKDFQLGTAVLDSISQLVERFVGDHIARSAIVAIFWAIVGLFVYVLIWAVINYSDEFGDDLAATKYLHPRNFKSSSPLREFISRSIFQCLVIIILILYINLLVGVLLPRIGALFQTSIQKWPDPSSFGHGALGIISEIIILHFLVILIRQPR